MDRKIKKYLYDISASIDHIFMIHLIDIKTKEDYLKNFTVQRAVERELGIIGEACHKLLRNQFVLSHADPMINRRHTLIHQYDMLKPGNIWDTVQHDLPSLKNEVDAFLKE